MKKSKLETSGAIMRTYRCNFHFSLLINMTLLLSVIHISEHVIFFKIHVQNSINKADKICIPQNMLKRLLVSGKMLENRKFSVKLLLILILSVLVTWLYIVLEKAGDVHPNPGPLSSSSSLSSSSLSNTLTGSISSNLNQFHHLSFIQYNVQSIINKLDLLTVELSEFDILAFSETWLHAGISTNDLLIPSYNYPERKDRDRDPHGGVVIYVKESLNYKRRQDLELPGIECIWLEIILQHKRLLFGLFYRPPNSDQIYHSLIEDSIHLAIDSGITDVIVTGDFNYNLMNDVTNRKILSICQQFSMHQYITEHLALFSLRTESDNPDATCELSP